MGAALRARSGCSSTSGASRRRAHSDGAIDSGGNGAALSDPVFPRGRETVEDGAMSRNQRLVLVASILGSFVAFLDIAVVNVALPAIRRELGGGIAAQQWVVDAYLLALGSLILTAGSLSDLFGRRRVFAGGLIGFALASALFAAAPS